MTDTQSSDVFGSQNNHFNVSQTNLQQDIEIGDNFCGTSSCHDGLIPGIFYPNDCYTYLGKKYGSTPATTVAGGLTHSTGGGYWAGVSSVSGAYYDLSAPNCDNCGEDPEPPSESGCMDPVACNYNPLATGISVGCCYEEGCTDPSAFNYEIGACCDDGSCCYTAGCTDQTACNWDHGVSCYDDGSCCYVSGCMDAAAFNYNSEACCVDNSCCYTSGCTDPTATNYDPTACYDDGSCEYCTGTETNSCETSGATNMNQFWDTQNLQNFDHLQWFISSSNYQIPFGSRYFEIDAGDSPCGEGKEGREGGTDNPCAGPNNGHYMSITNYEVSVEFSDGTTQSQVISSWNDAITFLNIAAQNPIFNSSMDWTTVQTWLDEIFGGTNTNFWTNGWDISISEIECCECLGGSACGCTDPLATNYDPNATFDDGSCTYCTYGCTDEACDNYDPNATCDDGSCNCDTPGCTDPLATNYNSNATVDDGSCTYIYGCTDPNATNYDSAATQDDGSCVYPCTWVGPTDKTGCVINGICDIIIDYNNSTIITNAGSSVAPVISLLIKPGSGGEGLTGNNGGTLWWLRPVGGWTTPSGSIGAEYFVKQTASTPSIATSPNDYQRWTLTLAVGDYITNAIGLQFWEGDGSCLYPVYGCATTCKFTHTIQLT
jgi:hypothetical protein